MVVLDQGHPIVAGDLVTRPVEDGIEVATVAVHPPMVAEVTTIDSVALQAVAVEVLLPMMACLTWTDGSSMIAVCRQAASKSLAVRFSSAV